MALVEASQGEISTCQDSLLSEDPPYLASGAERGVNSEEPVS